MFENTYIGEIQLFAGNFAPYGWLFCEGQLLPLTGAFYPLFALLETTYGGDGVTNFALPDLRGRAPMSYSTIIPLGTPTGSEEIHILPQNLPTHGHNITAQLKVSAEKADQPDPSGHYWATVVNSNNQPDNEYAATAQDGITMNTSITQLEMEAAGGNQPVDNMQPFLALHYIIAYKGEFPSRS